MVYHIFTTSKLTWHISMLAYTHLFNFIKFLVFHFYVVNIMLFELLCSHNRWKKHIMPNISRSKGSQKMKFCQLIEYNMRNNFLEKSNTKCGGEHFIKIQNWAYLWINRTSYAIKFAFIVFPSRGVPKYIKTKVLNACFYLI